jgi:hypothetical protein
MMAPNYLDFHNPALKALSLALALLGAVSLAGVVSLFRLSALRRELRAHRKLLQARKAQSDAKGAWDDCAQRIEELTQDLGELRRRLDVQEQAARLSVPLWPGEASPLQLNTRGQILRLAGKGRSIAEIAVDLGVSQGEVDLLLKVQDLGESLPVKKETRNVL